MALKTLFFDAGNTLVFADLSRTLAPMAKRGLAPTQEQLHAAERAAKKRLDAARAAHPEDSSVDKQFWDIYYTQLLSEMGFDHLEPELVSALSAATRHSSHWDRMRPGTAEVLERLGSRYRLGVIANADGHIADLLDRVGLGRYFLTFTDSALAGYEKPDPRIFQAALASLDARPDESMFVGDIYSVDYVGARGVGMDAMLMDVAGTYRDSGLPRVESLPELESRLHT